MTTHERSKLRAGILELLALMRAEERHFEAGLPAAERSEEGTAERWAARAVLAHVTDFKREQVVRLRAAADGSEPPPFPAVEHRDPAVYADYACRSWEHVSADAESTSRALCDRTGQLDDANLFTPGVHPWLHGRALWAQVLVRGVWHASAHLHQHLAEHGHLDRVVALQRCLYHAATDAGIPDEPGGRPFAVYNLACAHALAGDLESGLERLAEAVRLDPNLAAAASADPDLGRLHRHPRFDEIISGERATLASRGPPEAGRTRRR